MVIKNIKYNFYVVFAIGMAVGRACISIFCLLFLYVFMTFCENNITYSLKHQDKETFTAYMRMYRKYVFYCALRFLD